MEKNIKLILVGILIAFVLYLFRKKKERFTTVTSAPGLLVVPKVMRKGDSCTNTQVKEWYKKKYNQYVSDFTSYDSGTGYHSGMLLSENQLKTLQELKDPSLGNWVTYQSGESVMSHLKGVSGGSDYNQLGTLAPPKKKCINGKLTGPIDQGRIYHSSDTKYMTDQENKLIDTTDPEWWTQWIGSQDNHNPNNPKNGITIRDCMKKCDDTEYGEIVPGSERQDSNGNTVYDYKNKKPCKGFVYNSVERSCILNMGGIPNECLNNIEGQERLKKESNGVISEVGTQRYKDYLIFEKRGLCPKISTDDSGVQGNNVTDGTQQSASLLTPDQILAKVTNTVDTFSNVAPFTKTESRREQFRANRQNKIHRERPHYKTLDIPEPPQ